MNLTDRIRGAFRRETKASDLGDVLRGMIAARDGGLGVVEEITPDNCMQSPTVHAIVTAISRRLSVTPVHVYERGTSDGRETKKKLPSHPVAKLLAYPNKWQSKTAFWADAASTFVRYGRFYAYKVQGAQGPIRELLPILPSRVRLDQDNDNWSVIAKVSQPNGGTEEKPLSKFLHVRGASRNFLEGDSPVEDVRLAIALEIAAERFGATFFQNGAVPLLIFRFMQGAKGFKTAEQEKQFVDDFQKALGGSKRHRALLLPTGIETDDPVKVENDKAQFLETRKYQRTVIAGAFGVPPHLVGDLERATFNNVEQQDSDFTLNVIMPVAQAFEAAMERDLLTDEDWNRGIVIRFNLDSILRADFKSRQEGLQIQRQNGVINSDEWREIEGKNPIDPADGGDEFWRPSNMAVAGEPLTPAIDPGTSPALPNGAADDNVE